MLGFHTAILLCEISVRKNLTGEVRKFKVFKASE